MKKIILFVISILVSGCLFFMVQKTVVAQLAAVIEYFLKGIPKNAILGVDVSHHNYPVDWALLRENKMKFAYVKASEGVTHVDPNFHEYVKAARAGGMKVGAYHYFRAETPVKDQFMNFYAYVGQCDLIPMLDVEHHATKNLTKAQVRQRTMEFVNLCKKYYGMAPILYCSESDWKQYFSKGFEDCLWWADSKGVAPKTSWDLWQYNIENGYDRNCVKPNIYKKLFLPN